MTSQLWHTSFHHSPPFSSPSFERSTHKFRWWCTIRRNQQKLAVTFYPSLLPQSSTCDRTESTETLSLTECCHLINICNARHILWRCTGACTQSFGNGTKKGWVGQVSSMFTQYTGAYTYIPQYTLCTCRALPGAGGEMKFLRASETDVVAKTYPTKNTHTHSHYKNIRVVCMHW